MKKLFNIFSKQPAHYPVKCVSEHEWLRAYNAIENEYNEARKRQFTENAKPSSYMRGLAFAMKAMNACRPKEMEVLA